MRKVRNVETEEESPSSGLLTVREVAKRLRVDETTVRRWIGSGVLDAIRLPSMGKRNAFRVRSETLDRALETGSFVGE